VADSCPAQHPSPALLRYAAAHVQGFPAPAPALALTQFGHGQSNPTYCLRAASATETRRYVLRKKPAGAILQSAHAVEREFQVQILLTRFAAAQFSQLFIRLAVADVPFASII
jgi:acyl-CoA dehydrogenase